MTTVVEHAPTQLEATLKLPGQGAETVRIVAAYESEGKYLVAYAPLQGFDLGELGATVKVSASLLSDIHRTN